MRNVCEMNLTCAYCIHMITIIIIVHYSRILGDPRTATSALYMGASLWFRVQYSRVHEPLGSSWCCVAVTSARWGPLNFTQSDLTRILSTFIAGTSTFYACNFWFKWCKLTELWTTRTNLLIFSGGFHLTVLLVFCGVFISQFCGFFISQFCGVFISQFCGFFMHLFHFTGLWVFHACISFHSFVGFSCMYIVFLFHSFGFFMTFISFHSFVGFSCIYFISQVCGGFHACISFHSFVGFSFMYFISQFWVFHDIYFISQFYEFFAYLTWQQLYHYRKYIIAYVYFV